MPYIDKEARKKLCSIDIFPDTAGELNYLITEIVLNYLMNGQGENYQAYNDCLGALEGAKLELYRRRIAPYEDVKIKQNGDVY